MSDLEEHIDWVREACTDKTAALALIDRLQEEWSYSRPMAVRYVAVLRWAGRQERFRDRAAAIMRRRSRSSLMARDHVIVVAARDAGPNVSLIFLNGFRSPKVGVPLPNVPERFPSGLLVSVGAREYLRLQKEYLRSLRAVCGSHSNSKLFKKAGGK